MPDPAATPPLPPEPDSAQSIARRVGPAGLLAVFAAVVPGIIGIVLLANMELPSAWLREHGGAGPFVYALVFAVCAGLALLPTYSQSVLGGYAFGLVGGMGAALAGFAGGAVLGYEVARRASGDRVVRLIDEKPKWRAVRDALVGNGGESGGGSGGGERNGSGAGFFKTLAIVTLLRLPPNSPFALTNLVMASVRVPRAPYLLGTLIGLAPRTAAAVYVGTVVHELTKQEINNAVPTWVWIAGIALTVLILGVIGLIANKAVERVTRAS